MRVLFYNFRQGFDSGAPKVLAGLIERLDRSLIEPMYFANGEGPLVEALVHRGVEIVRGPVAKVSHRHPVAAVQSVLRQVARLRKLRIDLLHTFDYGWNLDLVLAAWLLRIPVILHEHLGGSADFQNLHRFAASKVLFCSRSVMEGFGSRHRILHKSEVLYNPVDVSAFQRGENIRSSLGLRTDQIVIGSVARVQHRKGIDILLDAARILIPGNKDLIFLITGAPAPGQEEFAEKVIESAKDPAFEGRVRFLGPRQDIPDLMASMDLFLFASRAEPFGVAVIEAMAAGLPVVASRVGGIPEIITSPDLGILVSDISGEGFAGGVNQVLKLADRGRAMGERARADVVRRFDGAIVAAKLQKIYLQVLERRNPGKPQETCKTDPTLKVVH